MDQMQAELKDSIDNEMKAAMKGREKVRLAAIRLIRDSIQKAEVAGNTTLDDNGVIEVLAKMLKQREESVDAYEKGGREDLAQRERAEIEIIREFMPEPMSANEITEMVRKAISDTGAVGPSDMGKVMKALKGAYEGRASGKDVSAEAKKLLSN